MKNLWKTEIFFDWINSSDCCLNLIGIYKFFIFLTHTFFCQFYKKFDQIYRKLNQNEPCIFLNSIILLQENLELLARGLFAFTPQSKVMKNYFDKKTIASDLYLFQRFLRIIWLHRKEFDYMIEEKLVNMTLLENAVLHVYDFRDKLSSKEKYKKAAEIFVLFWIKKQAIDEFLDRLHNVFVEECNRNIFLSTFSEEKANLLFNSNDRLNCLKNIKGIFLLLMVCKGLNI